MPNNSYFEGKVHEAIENLKERIKELKEEISSLKTSYEEDREDYLIQITKLQTKVRFLASFWGALISFTVSLLVFVIQKFFL